MFRLDTKDNFSQFKQVVVSNTVSEIDDSNNAKDIVPELDQDPELQEDQRDFWNKQKTDKSGVLLGHGEGNDENLQALKEFVNASIDAKHLRGNTLCLELACGGPLQLFDKILIDIFDKTDINESSDKQMKATYAAYDEILKRKKHYMKGKIENRFSCDLKHVSLERP